jgi:NADPH-dependent 2,4-dienoyl-CoA reductase/sulfur reductase-like enzyme
VKLRTVVIVGAGLAGARAAETLRAEGFDGRVVMIGAEPVAPYERPALSKEFLAGTRDETSLLLRPGSYWGDRGVELRLGERVTRLDAVARRLTTQSACVLGYDAVVLATGARPRPLPRPMPRGVHELRSLADAQRLREELRPPTRLVVIGGGLVGAEVASTALALGVNVTVVEAAPAPLARVLGPTVGLMLAERWRMHGVDVRVGTGLAGLRADAAGRIASVRLTDGTELRADVVLVAVGVLPVRELLPGHPVQGVVTAGDIAGPGHWTAASHDGVAAARRILGLPPLLPKPSYAWSDQFGLRLQVVGDPAVGAPLQVDGAGDSFAVRYRTSDGRVVGGLFANRPLDAAAVRRELDTGLAVSA